MNTAHPVAPEEVMAFLDGELSGAEAQAVSAHLDYCAECTILSQQFRGTSQALAGWHVPAVPAKLEQTVRDLSDKTRLEGSKRAN
jgi:anti-sigma factor RsiW